MEQYKTKALNILTEFPLSPEREALSELVKYTTERKK
jgi:geranylgeranyl pyrophosphate synthase